MTLLIASQPREWYRAELADGAAGVVVTVWRRCGGERVVWTRCHSTEIDAPWHVVRDGAVDMVNQLERDHVDLPCPPAFRSRP